MAAISKNLDEVLLKMKAAYSRVTDPTQVYPQLIAVSKLKSCDAILEAYNAGQRSFGENYIQELAEKSSNEKILAFCPEIKWHFLGRIQSNKVKLLTGVPNLAVVQTIDSLKVASTINEQLMSSSSQPLDILIQVNTSKEAQKGGVPCEDVVQLFKSISKGCDHLNLRGLMTIGKYDYDPSEGPNPDFSALKACRAEVCSALDLPENSLHLSMGMSSDFEMAIALGGTMVRVGSAIFGARQ